MDTKYYMYQYNLRQSGMPNKNKIFWNKFTVKTKTTLYMYIISQTNINKMLPKKSHQSASWYFVYTC